MKAEDLLKDLTSEQLKTLSRQELIDIVLGEQNIRKQLEKQLDQAHEEKILLEEKYVLIKSKIFGRTSEKAPTNKSSEKTKNKKYLNH